MTLFGRRPIGLRGAARTHQAYGTSVERRDSLLISGVMELARRILTMILGERAQSFRYPTLVLLTGVFFVIDLFVPDLLPFVDEILLGLLTLLLAAVRSRGNEGDTD